MGDVNPVAGAIFGAASNQDETAMQVGGSAAQVTTVQVASAANDTTYTLSIGEDAGSLIAVTFTTPSSGNTTTTVATGIANAINAKVGVSNLVFASSATDTVTITGRQKGASATFTVSESDSRLNTPSTTTSAGDATAIPFGVMVERSSATKAVGTAAIGSAVGSGTYTKQIAVTPDITTLVTLAAGDLLSLTVNGDFDGLGARDYTAQVNGTGTPATDITNAVTAMNAVLPANSVVVTEPTSNVLQFSAEVNGVGFTVSGFGTSSGIAAALTFAESGTTANAIPFGGGVALKSHTIEQNASGVSEYGMGDTFSGLTEGKCYVLLDSGITVAEGDACFVRVTAGASEQVGAFSNVSDSGDNLPIGSYGFKGIWVGGNETDMNGNNVAPLYISRA
jgi:hypothetical protein